MTDLLQCLHEVHDDLHVACGDIGQQVAMIVRLQHHAGQPGAQVDLGMSFPLAEEYGLEK